MFFTNKVVQIIYKIRSISLSLIVICATKTDLSTVEPRSNGFQGTNNFFLTKFLTLVNDFLEICLAVQIKRKVD